jgi:hypothetical protein
MKQQQYSSPPFTLWLWQEELEGSETDRRIEMEQQQHSSHLFTLRLWREDLGGSETEWRGKVQHVTSGEVRYFRDWPTLIAFLQQVLSGSGPNTSTD